MPIAQRITDVTFPDTIPIIPDFDWLESPGGLLMIDPAHEADPWAAGVPAPGAAVPNLAAASAAPLVGGAVPSVTVTRSGTPTLIERSARGGLHFYAPTTDAEPTLSLTFPTLVRDYIRANSTHLYFLNLWARTTKAPTANQGDTIFACLMSNTQFLIATFGQTVGPGGVPGSGAGGSEGTFDGTDLMTLGQTRFVGQFDPPVPGAGYGAYTHIWGQREGWGGQVFYRADLIDMTVDGRSYAELSALSAKAYDIAFGVGGRYNADTFTPIA